jgi:hypothetical protein
MDADEVAVAAVVVAAVASGDGRGTWYDVVRRLDSSRFMSSATEPWGEVLSSATVSVGGLPMNGLVFSSGNSESAVVGDALTVAAPEPVAAVTGKAGRREETDNRDEREPGRRGDVPIGTGVACPGLELEALFVVLRLGLNV